MKLLIFAMLLLCGAAHADGIQIEASVGHTQFGKTENGIWYQNGFDHTLDLQSNSWSVGVTGYATSWMRWRAQWSQLGTISTNAQGVADANYNGYDGCRGPCWNVNTYKTEGSLRGLSLTLAPEMYIGGGIKGFVEGGIFYNLTKFDAVAGETANTLYWNNQYREGLNLGTQIGVGIDYKGTQIVLTYYKADAPTDDPNAIINRTGDVLNLSLRQRF